MKKVLPLAIALIAVAFAFGFGCNKQKTAKLDYSEKVQKGVFAPSDGLPGQTQVGAPAEADKYHGYRAGDGEKSPPPKAEEPGEKKPDEKKPDEKQPQKKQAE